jgi:DNA (cytosine-5)-methyltransferase 1
MRCVELFAGAGGAALGLEETGVEHLALVEWDKDACATMRAAGLGPLIEGDVRDIYAIESVVTDEVDLLWSSFPCQGWSSAGARLGARDPRNGWPWTVAAIDRLQPRWFLGENVRGLTMHSGCASELDCPGCYLRGVIVPQLEERFAHAGYWVLDAADYGVPQHRRRVILWAGPAPLQAPASTHGPPGQGDLFRRLKPWVTMGEALGLGSFTWDASRNNDRNPRQERPTPSTEPAPALGTKGNQYILQTATGRRRLTVEECAALQSFPPSHPWRGTKRSKYQQVGNAVPPPLARVVAQRVLEADASLT